MSDTQHSVRDHSPGVHVTAAAQRADDTIVAEQGFAGLTIKQVMPGRYVAPADKATIASGEKYYLWDTGEVDVLIPTGFAPAKGDKVYIEPGTQALTKTASGTTLKVGKVRYVGPERGLRSDMMTIGFDARKDL